MNLGLLAIKKEKTRKETKMTHNIGSISETIQAKLRWVDQLQANMFYVVKYIEKRSRPNKSWGRHG